MSKSTDINQFQQRKALDFWLTESRRRMRLRFPKIDFDAESWPIKTLYGADQKDWYFTESLADFGSKDVSYVDVLRCLVAEMVIAGKPRNIENVIRHYRRLALGAQHRLFDFTQQDFCAVEKNLFTYAKAKPQAASGVDSSISTLINQFSQLAGKGVLPRLGFHRRNDIKAELRRITVTHRARQRAAKGQILDRQIEAYGDAFNAMVANPMRNGAAVLSPMDRVAICAMAILLCAPSRINEILCMSVDDFVTIEDYAQKPITEQDTIHRAHQMLIMTMKGSKGAKWGAKPVLNFMIDVFHYCLGVIKESGKHSRMLVEWYQKHPETLYLPPDLEYLRGQNLSRWSLAKVVRLSNDSLDTRGQGRAETLYFNELKGRQFKGPNPYSINKSGHPNSRTTVDLLAWADVEGLLLKKVRQAMDSCHKVTAANHYEGDLSKMLFLHDRGELRFLPHALNDGMIADCLKRTETSRKQNRPPTVFEKLNITMPVGGKVHIAELGTHDLRRWLTTMALIHGENLSDVLINKWANRCSLSQLKNYDLRTAETMAAQSTMPEAVVLKELTDLSNGLATLNTLEKQFGLQTAIVTAHDAGVAMTSMDEVVRAIDNRPVAKSSRGIIIIYPQRFGVCFHQHHEKPCRNYSNELMASCLTCNDGAVTKGHLPTNEEIRKISKKLFDSVILHLENLALTHNRNIADDPAALGEHMLTLIEKGLSQHALEQFGIHLIEEFHKINDLLKDRLLARRLEQAFVSRGFVKLLDEKTVSNGALIKYHNPSQHSDPLLEIALEAQGSRTQVELEEQALIAKYPQFAPKASAPKDERHLMSPDNDEVGD